MAGSILQDMTDRGREVFRLIVESYLETGEPVGSRSISRSLKEGLSPATIRNVMQDLEHMGLLNSPHISAGRIPSQLGLRLFVDSVMEIGPLDDKERDKITSTLSKNPSDANALFNQIGSALSGLTQGASLVLAPKNDARIKHIEIVPIRSDQALVVLVHDDGTVENRLFTIPLGVTPSSMREAANFLNSILENRTLSEMRDIINKEITIRRHEIDELTKSLIDAGMASWETSKESGTDRLIVRGRANLLGDDASEEDLERVKLLFDDLERKNDLVDLLELSENATGVRVFIGSENKLFSLSGSSLVISPYMNSDKKVIGAIGVIGPTRLNYGRIVPIVDYTANLVGRILSGKENEI